MIRSMTGFATKNITLHFNETEKANITINLKSLNSRFFENTCKLPYALNALETEFIKMLKKKLRRGHVYLVIHMDNQNVFKGSVQPSISTVNSYLQAIETIKKETNVSNNLELRDILRLPNIFTLEEHGLDATSKKTLLEAVDALADDLIIAQEQEGAALKTDITTRVEHMQQEMSNIATESKKLIEKQKNTVNELTAQVDKENIDPQIATQLSSAYAFLDKIDIHEEITRFNSHIESLQEQVSSNKIDKGKRLDFTLQELAREINTITAKCSDAAISKLAINIKVELEKAREQAQNIV